MKKPVFTIMLALMAVIVVNAQDLTSKKGTPILPEKGDYSVSIDAVPFFYYLGNMFHGNSTTASPAFDFPGLGNVPQWTLQVKKFISVKTALRARIRLGYSSNTIKNTILDQTNTSSTPAYVDDKWTESRMNIVLGAGLEKRRGKGRVQGLYGAMVNIMLATHGNNLVYGNEMSSTYINPLSTEYPWIEDGTNGYITENAASRVLKDNAGMGFGIGINTFLGVEYFFAPKMSIGGEFSWGVLLSISGKSKVESEGWDGSAVSTTTYKSGGSTYIGVDNGNTGGAINLSFYF
jgi:hypothetical protein